MVSRTIAQWHDAMPEEMFEIGGGRSRRHLGLAGIGGGAVGAAVMGVLALGASPANAPGSVEGPTEVSYASSLTSTVTAVVDRADPRAAQSSLRQQAHRSRADVDPVLRALRRTLAQ
jgi:hypothetical protein